MFFKITYRVYLIHQDEIEPWQGMPPARVDLCFLHNKIDPGSKCDTFP